jgi:hypothetical protein
MFGPFNGPMHHLIYPAGDDAAQIRTGLCLEIDMLPEVTELTFVFAGNEKRRPRKALPPFLAAHEPHLGQAETLALVSHLALAHLHLADSVWPAGIAAVAHVLNEEGAGARDGQLDLACPLVRDVRRAHHLRGTGPPFCKNVDRAARHERLARAELGDDARCLGVAEVLCSASDGQSVGRKRLAQERSETGRHRIFRALERWIGLKDAFGQERAKLPQVVERGLQADTSEAKDFWLYSTIRG